MTVRRLLMWKAIAIVLVVSLLALAGEVKLEFYEQLLSRCDSVVSRAQSLLPIRVQLDKLDELLPDVTRDSLARIFVVTKHKEVREVRYYVAQQLHAVDKPDDAGKLARRDIYDGDSKIRIRIFFDSRGTRISGQYLDEEGEVVHTHIFGLPYLGPWRIY